MSEIGDDFKEYRKAQQERRAARLPVRTKEICNLVMDGYSVERMTDYQFRINDRLDIYPIHNRYHDIKSGERGGFKTLKGLLMKAAHTGMLS